jgi:hypothetical protein
MGILFVFIILSVLTFVNILVPISDSVTITPLLALITDPHNAIGLVSFYFVFKKTREFFKKETEEKKIHKLTFFHGKLQIINQRRQMYFL